MMYKLMRMGKNKNPSQFERGFYFYELGALYPPA